MTAAWETENFQLKTNHHPSDPQPLSVSRYSIFPLTFYLPSHLI